MSESSFKDFIKKIQRYPVVYKEDHCHQNSAIPPILSFVERSAMQSTPETHPEQTMVYDSAGVIKIKLMNGEIKEFPATGTLSSLKATLKNQMALQNESIRLLHKGRPLIDESLDLSTLRDEQLNAITSSLGGEGSYSFLTSPRFKTDLLALLIRHGLSPHQAEQLANNFINQSGNRL